MQAKSLPPIRVIGHDPPRLSTFDSSQRLSSGRGRILSDGYGTRRRAGRNCRRDYARWVCGDFCNIWDPDRASPLHLDRGDRGGFTIFGSAAGLDLVEQARSNETFLLFDPQGRAWRLDAAQARRRLVELADRQPG